ncbi:MAG: hypothetical protein WCS52_17670 [bacterium]
MKKVCGIALAVLALAVTGAMAEETAAPAEKGAETPAKELVSQDMTIVGTITKHENKKKDGTPMMTWFNLVDEEGQEVRLPKGKVDEYVGSKVKVTGTGYSMEKKGKTIRAFKTITTIEKVDAPAAK